MINEFINILGSGGFILLFGCIGGVMLGMFFIKILEFGKWFNKITQSKSSTHSGGKNGK